MRRLVFAFMLGMGCTLLFAASALASFPGQSGKIAFAGSIDGLPGIYTVNADGSGLMRVVAGGDDPAWSADGRRLTYVDRGLFIANQDGSEQARIKATTGTSGPTSSTVEVFSEPGWSPDGGTIAYEVSELTCAQRVGCLTELPLGLRAISPIGTGDRLLRNYPAGDPSYSPDGTRLAWDDALFYQQFHVSNLDGTGPTTYDGLDPAWSPDGTRLAFSRGVAGLSHEIHVMNADGSAERRLTSDYARNADPVWSPDGTKLLWSSDAQLAVMNADGSGQRLLLPGTFSAKPDWQPLIGPRREDYKNAAKFCKAERNFMGHADFEQKYGGGANAHGECVSAR